MNHPLQPVLLFFLLGLAPAGQGTGWLVGWLVRFGWLVGGFGWLVGWVGGWVSWAAASPASPASASPASPASLGLGLPIV